MDTGDNNIMNGLVNKNMKDQKENSAIESMFNNILIKTRLMNKINFKLFEI